MIFKVRPLIIEQVRLENGKINKSLYDINGSILSISQFTLYADLSHGHRPGFTNAMAGEEAVKLYHKFNEILKNEYKFHLTII